MKGVYQSRVFLETNYTYLNDFQVRFFLNTWNCVRTGFSDFNKCIIVKRKRDSTEKNGGKEKNNTIFQYPSFTQLTYRLKEIKFVRLNHRILKSSLKARNELVNKFLGKFVKRWCKTARMLCENLAGKARVDLSHRIQGLTVLKLLLPSLSVALAALTRLYLQF